MKLSIRYSSLAQSNYWEKMKIQNSVFSVIVLISIQVPDGIYPLVASGKSYSQGNILTPGAIAKCMEAFLQLHIHGLLTDPLSRSTFFYFIRINQNIFLIVGKINFWQHFGVLN